jgi:uncharacterized zinc-type alcohol dehydrogenase-like protein
MIQAKGYAAMSASDPLIPYSFERRDPKEHDVVIDIKFSGICHSDIHTVRNEWKSSTYPIVPGHEIAGVVTQVGTKVTKYKVGDHVGVGCFVDSCRTCQPCEVELQQFCQKQAAFTYNGTEMDRKTPTQGGYSDKIVVDENYVLKIPQNIPLDKAAPLLCAGITLFSPLNHWKAGKGKNVAIVGLGGLGHMGVKIAAAMGAEVTVLSQSLKKKEDGIAMGAKHFHATSNPETFAQLAGTFDLIINTVSDGIDWNAFLNLLKIDGTMVQVGVPERPVPVHAFSLLMGRRSLSGSLIGGIQETQQMLDFCGKHNITPEIEVIPMNKVNEAYERVLKSDVRYRFVLDIATI